MASFLEKNKDFVLKLKIKSAGDQTQIRRVCLPRIVDVNGNISYDELVGLVLVFTLPEEDTTTMNSRTYTVSLTYFDEQKDLITLASTEELMDAIELFAGQKFMRITTCVKPKISYSTPPTSAATYVENTTASSSADHGTTREGDIFSPTPPIRVVLESFAGILSNAVNNLQEGLATQSPTSDRPDKNHRSCSPTEGDTDLKVSTASPSNASNEKALKTKVVNRNKKGQQVKPPNGREVNKVSNNLASRRRAAYKQALAGTNFKARSSAIKEKVSSESSDKAKKPANGREVDEVPNNLASRRRAAYSQAPAGTSSKASYSDIKEKVSIGSSDKAKESEETNVVEPFIHGRHTCDGCLETPIIGKRYHSTNLMDYDLCQKCNDNYKGSGVTYESVELYRDIAFQNRWRLRHQMAVKLKAMRNQSGRGSYGPNAPRYREQNHGKFNSHRVGKASQCGPGLVVRENNRTQSKAVRDKTSSTSTVSRHSKAGRLMQNKADTNPASKDNATSSNEFDNLLKEAIRRSLDDAVPKDDSTMKSNGAAEIKNNCSHEASVLSKTKPLVENKVSENDFSDAKDDIPRSVDIMEHKMTDVERVTYSDATLDNISVSFELKDVTTMQNAMDTDSVDSEKLLSKFIEGGVLPTDIDDRSGIPSSKQRELDNSKNDSFASDAVGNGDVAEEMGKTLDMVAGVISEMLAESEDLENPNENGKALDNESKQGELIVNSNDGIAKVDESEDDADWSVVKSIGSNGTTESEKIGKAAEMLGSALFNSDMKNSAEDNDSNLTGSDSSFSIPSSVPTDLGTVHSTVAGPSQVTRWATEIEKLRELGFDNEESCIEILERIGPDSNITVDNTADNIDRAINELLLLNA